MYEDTEVDFFGPECAFADTEVAVPKPRLILRSEEPTEVTMSVSSINEIPWLSYFDPDLLPPPCYHKAKIIQSIARSVDESPMEPTEKALTMDRLADLWDGL